MCLSPISKKNPNYGLASVGLNFFKDCNSQYIKVPCGHCAECIANKQMQLVQRVQMHASKNHIFMITLTYDNKHLPILTTSQGYKFRYADIHHVQLMFKRIRNQNLLDRPFSYVCVSERGSEGHRPHFHILLFIPKQKGDDFLSLYQAERIGFDLFKYEWRINVSTSRKNPVYEPLFTYKYKFVNGKKIANYDFHYVNPSTSLNGELDVAFYCLKYMMKLSDYDIRLQRALKLNYEPDEYKKIWNTIKSRYTTSKGFGLPDDVDVQSYIRSCINKSSFSSDYPCFYNPINGKSFPLSNYYKKKLFTLEDAMKFPIPSEIPLRLRNDKLDIKKWNDYISKADVSSLKGQSIFFDDI